jgi:acyl carrier protein
MRKNGIVSAVGMAIVAAGPLAGGCASATDSQREQQRVDTAQKVHAIVREILGADPGKIVPKARFIEDLGADSLDCVELAMAFEEKFDIAIADADVLTIKTVDDATAYIDKQRGKRP